MPQERPKPRRLDKSTYYPLLPWYLNDHSAAVFPEVFFCFVRNYAYGGRRTTTAAVEA